MTRTPHDDDRARFERDRNAFFRALDGLDHTPVPGDSDLARLLALNGRDGLLDAPRGAADLLELGADEPTTLDRYELGELLGRGGMGIVHRATDRRTGAAVAVKFLRPSLVNDGFRRRFAREVATLERLDDPGFGRLLDSGTFASPLGDVPYLVTELIEGGTLMEWAQDADAGARLDLLIALCRTL
ncbi:hypothetical protein KDK88_08300, partial [bacterium]|nr:hypothetical protein [bacterium]